MMKKQTSQKKIGNRVLLDAKGTRYTLVGEMGEGAQGKVCTTDIPGVLIKVLHGTGTQKHKEWSEHVQWLMRQDLTELNLARPLEILVKPENVHAYVMELMDGLLPLEEILSKTHQSLLENSLNGFTQTGGLKRRLLLLRELANTLNRLHSKGFAYGDLSPANIFVSSSVKYHQLWLIDCDNICISERSGFGHIFTPGYGAPEVIRGDSGVNMLTDSWSFAALAFKLLTNNHPFLSGLGMEEAEEEDGASDTFTEQAARGVFPWIYDDKDDSNAWDKSGLLWELATTPLMRQLFHRCFGLSREDLTERPLMGEWYNALNEACTRLLVCTAPNCGQAFLYHNDKTCHFCDEKSDPKNHLLLRYYIYNNEPFENDSPWICTPTIQLININEKINFHLIPMGAEYDQDAPVACSIELKTDGLYIEPTNGFLVQLQRNSDAKTHNLIRKQRLKEESRQGGSMALHLRVDKGDALAAHSVWKFVW